MPDRALADETEETMMNLAEALQKSGFKVMGVTHCYWTKVQRNMFGDKESPARQLLERNLYVECRGDELCPGVMNYPTWMRGDLKWEGYQPPAKLREMIREASQVEPRQMLKGPAEPNEVNIPDAKHLGSTDSKQVPEQVTSSDIYNVLRNMKANEFADLVAKVESDRTGAGIEYGTISQLEKTSSGSGSKTTLMQQGEGKGLISPMNKEIQQEEAMHGTKRIEIRKENVRGVSAYASLNVPDMPGTAPMNLDLEHADFQNKQGNIPRASFENHEPKRELARQMVAQFNNAVEHAVRDPNASSYSQTRMEHSADITTGDALAEKRVPYEMNQGP
jgi:hypothetical protein